MRIVVALKEFKGSMAGVTVVWAMQQGVVQADPSVGVIHCPVADGISDILCHALDGEHVLVNVAGPSFTEMDTSFCHIDSRSTAVIEMARASDLGHLLNPLITALSYHLSTDQKDPGCWSGLEWKCSTF